MRNERGFSLTELIVVMAIFIIVIMISSYAFETIIRRGGQQAKSASSQIEGMVGLEMLRTDISHAGFALPWTFSNPPAGVFHEVTVNPPSITGITATDFNDITPRAVVSGSFAAGSDYLVLKSALLALDSPTIGKWGIVNYASAGGSNTSYISRIGDANSDLDQTRGDRVITVLSGFTATGAESKLLLMDGTNFSYRLTSPSYRPPDGVSSTDAFRPLDATQSVIAYGISDQDLTMPYNRADYYIDFNAAKPASCNPQTGILYKAVAGQTGNYKGKNGTDDLVYPLLNCVADFKVAYFLDMNDDGNPGTYYMNTTDINLSSNEGATVANVLSTLADAALLRQRLRNVIVYVLAHEGAKDTNFIYPYSDASKVFTIGEPVGAHKYWSKTDLDSKLGANWTNYRWKVYAISVNLKNL